MLIEQPRIPIKSVLLYGLWPSFIKVLLYRLKGYKIGKGVSISFGSIIEADRAEIGDHASIGFLTIIRGTEVRLGPYVQIGSTTFLDTPYIDIGEGSKINEQVFIGGLQNHDSKFVMGRNCQIMQMSFINPARNITMGDDSGIGGHSLVFGHESWLSKFEGYSVEFAPIEIGNSVSLAWRVFVLPGTKIGDGAVVGANSLVRGVIPPRCLAVGYPARVVSRAPDFPKELTGDDKVAIFRDMVGEMAAYFNGSGLGCVPHNGGYQILTEPAPWWRGGQRKVWRLAISDGEPSAAPKEFGGAHVFLSLTPIEPALRKSLDAQGTVWIDMAAKQRSRLANDLADEVALYMKRYGVRVLRAD